MEITELGENPSSEGGSSDENSPPEFPGNDGDGGTSEGTTDGSQVEPEPEPEPVFVPIENCVANSMGSMWHEEGPIPYQNQSVQISGEHLGSERCVTALSFVFSHAGKCPLTLQFNGKGGIWNLQNGTLRSDVECGEGWGSGKTYVALLEQSQVSLLGVPKPVDIGNGQQSCTPLEQGIELLGTLIVEAGGTTLELGLSGLNVQGKILTDAVLTGTCGADPAVCEDRVCGQDPAFGVSCGTCAQGSFCMEGHCKDGTPAQEACARFNQDRIALYEGNWNGNVSSCSGGIMDSPWQERALKMANLYRWFADLPPLALNTSLYGEQQSCALIMHANNTLSHNPGQSWKCYTQNGADGAGNSNIATMPAVGAVDLYMIDPGNASTMGHRRWILSNWIGYTAFGSTSKYSCMATISGEGGQMANKSWTAWPPAGFYPIDWHAMSWTNTDQTGWSIQSDTINLNGAQVTITQNGQNRAVKVNSLAANYGSKFAISMTPIGWTTQPNTTYQVSVNGISQPISYKIQTLDCSQSP